MVKVRRCPINGLKGLYGSNLGIGKGSVNVGYKRSMVLGFLLLLWCKLQTDMVLTKRVGV